MAVGLPGTEPGGDPAGVPGLVVGVPGIEGAVVVELRRRRDLPVEGVAVEGMVVEPGIVEPGIVEPGLVAGMFGAGVAPGWVGGAPGVAPGAVVV